VQPLKKEPRKSLSYYKNYLWKFFSQYIRLRDKGICFTCGYVGHWVDMQAGHFIPRSTCGLLLYFDERNNNCQCFRCNQELAGNTAVYGKRIIDIYGVDVFNDLIRKHNQSLDTKWTRDDYKIKIKKYQRLVEELKKGKDFSPPKRDKYLWE